MRVLLQKEKKKLELINAESDFTITEELGEHYYTHTFLHLKLGRIMEEQYLTEKHYVVCDKGVTPKQLKVTSQSTTFMSGHKAATEKDTLLDNNFLCVGGMMFAAGAAAGICACIPGPGWIVAAAIAIALIAVAAIGYFKCKAAATSRVWTKQSPVLQIEGKKALLLSSIMMCPAEGGTITPKETFWAAWGSQALTNLGHVANFAFGFLAGRGAGAIAGEGIAAGMAVEAGGMAAVRTGMQTAGRSFLNAARTELVESFTFKGWKNAGTFCKIMRGMGIGGAYYEQYNIWTSDKDTVDKLKDSSVGLILSIFAGKGASLVCFPEGTKVHTDKGLQNIENLLEGDLVLTFNEETLEQEFKPILVRHERYTMNMMALELPTGEVLEVTPEHRFYHNGEWIEAASLQTGDLLHLKNGDYTTIINIENFPKYQKVYNFDVEGNENYYVTEDGILVHNGYQSGRLPRNNGEWIEGVPGEGLWKSDNPLVNAVTDNQAVPFKNGRPDFSEWKFDEFKVEGMNGTKSDFSKIHEKLAEDLGLKNKTAAENWLKENGLTAHHLDNETIQLIPSDLHNNIPHKGSASDMRELFGL